LHQFVEYGIAAGLIMLAAQTSTPAAPAVVGAAMLLNAACTPGPLGAFRWFSRRMHRALDWAIIVVALVAAFVLDIDQRARLALVSVALVHAIVTLGTNFAVRAPRQGRAAR
jgi:hypothetical protein